MMEPSVRVRVPIAVRVLSLAIVMPELPVLLIVTWLKVAVEGVMVKFELPSNTTVPELCVNVGAPEMVNVLETERVPEVEVNEPPERAKVPLMSMVPLPPAKVPSAWEKLLEPTVRV